MDYRDELKKARQPFYDMGTHLMVLCPFHADNNPSLRLETTDGKFQSGFFKCWGCGTCGRWNKLARKLGMAYQEQSDAPTPVIEEAGDTAYASVKELAQSCSSGGGPWPNTEWRGIHYKTIQQCNGYLVTHKEEQRLLLPIEIDGEIKGGVMCALHARDKIKYLTTPGKWASHYGLLPFQCIPADTQYVVLVEGPRDALRLLAEGIPALATLGAGNVNPKKLSLLLEFADLKAVVALGDGDDAGMKFNVKVKEHCAGLAIPAFSIRLPDGQDPFSLSQTAIQKLKRKIAHGLGKVEA